MKIQKNFARGMVISGLVNMVGFGAMGAYFSLTEEQPTVTEELSERTQPSAGYNPVEGMYTLGVLASVLVFGVGMNTYNRRRKEELYVPRYFG